MADAAAPVMLMPSVDRYMTRQPWTIRTGATLSQALATMREHEVRHLPVIDQFGDIVGILSERDLGYIETIPGLDPDETIVEEAMRRDVYKVGAETPMDAVVERMADARIGSAIVVNRHGQLVGILTTVDALQCFADVLRREAG